MNCDDIRALFSEHFDNELDEVSAHLQNCAECAGEFEEYTRLLNQVRNLPEPDLPAGFHDALMRGVRTEARRKKRMAFMPFAMSAAASFLVGLLWFSGAFNFSNENYDFVPVAMPAPTAAAMDTPAMDEPAARMPVEVWDIAPRAAVPIAPFAESEAEIEESEIQIVWGDEDGIFIEPLIIWEEFSETYSTYERSVIIWPLILIIAAVWIAAFAFYFTRKRW